MLDNEVDLSRVLLPGADGCNHWVEGADAKRLIDSMLAEPTPPTASDLGSLYDKLPSVPGNCQASPPTLADDTVQRQALRDICHFADVLQFNEDTYLVVKATPLLLDLLAEFEAEVEDREEDDHGGDVGCSDDEPSLGATEAPNQERGWGTHHNGADLEFDGDTVADCDLEDGNDLEAENEHGGDVNDEPQDEDTDREPSLGWCGNAAPGQLGGMDDREDEDDGREPENYVLVEEYELYMPAG